MKMKRLKREKIGLVYKGRKINICPIKKISELGKIRGLMFRNVDKCPALLFEFSNPTKLKIHSLFVFFPFLAVWTDNKNKVIEKRIVKPWRFSVGISRKYSKLIEIPLSNFYLPRVKNIVGQRFK